jgi:NAD+ synthase (glutamine-hydrolysing)
MRKLKVAMCQMGPRAGAIKENVTMILDLTEQARKAGADLAIFPEMCITGYCIADLIEDEDFLAENKKALFDLAARIDGIAAVVGFVDYKPEAIRPDGFPEKYNAAALIQDGEIKGLHYKMLLPDDRYFDDKRYFTAGFVALPLEMELDGQKVLLGLEVCEDLWEDAYNIKPARLLAENGADLLVNISASPYFAGKPKYREELILRRVKDYGVPFVFVNTSGIGDNSKNIIPFDGNSRFYDKQSNLIGAMGHFEEGLSLVELDLESGLGQPVSRVRPSPEAEIFEALVVSLRKYAWQGGFKSCVLGLSGGVDSALCAIIAAEALGKENVFAVNMPSRYNTEETRGAARALAERLGINYKVTPIQDLFDAYLDLFEDDFSGYNPDTTEENLQARIRANILMAFSNKFGHLLLATGNKTEIALGYSTLYGDMTGGLEVIGDLGKMDVYRLSEYVNETLCGREVIPAETLTMAASAELRENQVDPFDYAVVDPVVRDLIEFRKGASRLMSEFEQRRLNPDIYLPDKDGKTIYDKYDPEEFAELVRGTQRRIQSSVYKRTQAPPIIVVSRRAFGYDLRESIQNLWYHEK